MPATDVSRLRTDPPPSDAPTRVAGRLVPAQHSARISDALLMGLLVVRVGAAGLPVPTGQAAVIALICLALCRRPTRSLRPVQWFPVITAALLCFAAAESWSNGADFTRRLTNVAVLLVMAGFLASGRIDIGSALKGLLVAAGLNVVLFYAGVAPDEYAGKLTGFLQDKNASGLFYAVVPLLATMVARRPWQRVAILLGGAACLVGTDSRTSMAAYLVGIVWLAIAPWLRRPGRIVLGVALALAFGYANSNLAEVGHYADDRSGSDALRSRIDLAASLKAAGAPWYGRGLGQAVVELEGSQWFFHNSYDALRVEGGVVMLVAVIAIYAFSSLGLSRRDAGRIDRDGALVGAAALVVFCCATRLGEVFFAPTSLVVVGIGLARLAGQTPWRPPWAAPRPRKGG
ncbi:hypothetical protein GCM10027053_10860 [Intrasporangium mesophilum]